MQEARTITIDTLRPLRRAVGAGVLCVGHLSPRPPSRGRESSQTRPDQYRAHDDRGREESPRRASAALAMVSRCVADTERRTAQLNGNR